MPAPKKVSSSAVAPNLESARRSLPSPAAQSRYVNPANEEILRTAIRRPLISVWGAALLLNTDETQIEKFMQNGKLEFVFDIGLGSPRKRCCRILTSCVFDLKAGIKSAARALPAVIDSILPQARPTMFIREIAFAWHCSPWHVCLLVKAGLLASQSTGRQMRVLRASLVKFLTERRTLA